MFSTATEKVQMGREHIPNESALKENRGKKKLETVTSAFCLPLQNSSQVDVQTPSHDLQSSESSLLGNSGFSHGAVRVLVASWVSDDSQFLSNSRKKSYFLCGKGSAACEALELVSENCGYWVSFSDHSQL